MRKGIHVAALLLIALLGIAAADTVVQSVEPRQPGGDVVVIILDGDVDDSMRDGLKRRFNEAETLGADTIILQINTYGGLVTSALDISRFIKRSDLNVIALIDDKALSAGCMIALACDEIVMEPASLIGDCGVIAMNSGGGLQELGDTERAKAESPVLAEFDDSARRNGYSTRLAESFVRVSVVVHAIENTRMGETRFVGPEERDRLLAIDGESEWRDLPNVPVPLDSETSLLTLGDQTAARIGFSKGTFATPEALAASRGYNVLATLMPSGGERLIGLLSSFAVRGILMTVLFLSLYAAFHTPGTGVPEAIVAALLVVLFGVPWLTGFAQWYEILAVVVGIVLIAMEIFVIPGFGLFGLSGIVLLVTGLAFSFVGPVAIPGLPAGFGVDWNNLGYGLLTVVLGLFSSLLLWAWLSRYLPHMPYARGIILKDAQMSDEERARQAVWPTVGSEGVAVSDLRPGGTAKFAITDLPGDTANTDVVCDRGFVFAGTPLMVVEANGNRIVVRPAGERRTAQG